MAADVTRHTNRLRDALTSICPALERDLGSKLSHPGIRDLLTKYPTPTALRHAGHTRIHAVIAKRSPRLATKTSTAVWTAINTQTVTTPGEAVMGSVITELGDIRDRRDLLELEISNIFAAHPLGAVLQSMPGIGPRTGARILAEIGDASSFPTGDQLAAYAGLAPVTQQSGTSIKGEQRSRRGNHRLKNAMFLAAFASLRSPDSRAFYDRKRAEGKKHNAAVMCLARRRCNVIHHMLRNAEHYQLRTPTTIEQESKKAA